MTIWEFYLLGGVFTIVFAYFVIYEGNMDWEDLLCNFIMWPMPWIVAVVVAIFAIYENFERWLSKE
jgi:hypothetical protein